MISLEPSDLLRQGRAVYLAMYLSDKEYDDYISKEHQPVVGEGCHLGPAALPPPAPSAAPPPAPSALPPLGAPFAHWTTSTASMRSKTITCILNVISAHLPDDKEEIVVEIVMTNYKNSILCKIEGNNNN